MMFQKKFIRTALFVLVLAMLAAVCVLSFLREKGAGTPFSERMLFVMDSYCEIAVQGAAADDISAMLYTLEDKLDSFDEYSEVSQLNAGAPLPKDAAAAEVIRQTLALQAQIPGGVDITSGALTKLWGITTAHPRVPTKDELHAALETVGISHVNISGTEMTLDSGTQIDLGAVAKGYALDCAKELLEEKGAVCGKVSLTSSMLLFGEKADGSPFEVRIRAPEGEDVLGTVRTQACFLSTSGGYERFFTDADGKTYIHILDPKSGRPIETDLASVTVFCDNGLLSDYLSTLIYMGGTDALAAHLEADAYRLVAVGMDGQVYVSDGLDFVSNSCEQEIEMEEK